MRNYDNLSNLNKEKIVVFFQKWILQDNLLDQNFSSVDSKIVFENFSNDHFLDPSSFQKIVDFLLRESDMTVEEMLIKLREYIRIHCLCNGGDILEKPFTVGSVFIKDNLKNFLLREYKNIFVYDDDIDNFLLKNSEDYYDDEKDCLLKANNYLIWVTWNNVDSNQNPFSFSEKRIKHDIISALGLCDFYFSRDDLLLVVFKTNELLFKRPTIADANFDNDLWRPTELNFKKYGLTKSRNGYNDKRPEAIIESEFLNMINIYKKIENYE